MAEEGVIRSSDVWQENGMPECAQSFSPYSEANSIAVNEEGIAAQFRTFLRQPGMYVTNCIMDVGQGVVQNDCQNMDIPGPSETPGNFHQDSSIPNAGMFGIIRKSEAHVEVVEEPLSDGIKFRYEREGRQSSRIIGVNSTKTLKTFPTIKIHGYQGAAYVVVSLVSLGPPYYPHPHKLAGKSCKNGVCVKQIDNPEMICGFFNLRIQCVKRKDVKASLAEREALQIDPFRTGFSHSQEPNKINYKAIRLCFQVFLPDSNVQFCRALDPVLSAPIGNKTVCDLAIMKLSHCSAPVSGHKEVILLCGQVRKDDIEIVFYEENEEKKVIWVAKGQFSPDDVHYKVAISFQTPAYINPNSQKQVKCFVFLRRPSDGLEGKPREFTLNPSRRDLYVQVIADKRRKFQDSDLHNVLQVKNNVLQSTGAVNHLPAYNIPVNQLDPPAPAPVLENTSNFQYASSYYSKQPVSTAGAEYLAIQPNVHQNIDINPVDEQMESLSGNLSELTIDPVREAVETTPVGLIGGKIVEEQNPFQVNYRGKDGGAEISADNAYQREFNSNESCGNLSGMTIDSFTESVALISVGLIVDEPFQ